LALVAVDFVVTVTVKQDQAGVAVVDCSSNSLPVAVLVMYLDHVLCPEV
jgi:hypothetical protein